MQKEENFKSAMRNVRTFAIGVEGVLSSDGFVLDKEGHPQYRLSGKDLLALNKAAASHYFLFFFSPSPPNPIALFLQKNGFESAFFECDQPLLQLEKEMILHKIRPQEIAGIAAMESDQEWLRHCGIRCCTGDAVPTIREMAHYNSPEKGGAGAIYDCIRQVMLVRGEW